MRGKLKWYGIMGLCFIIVTVMINRLSSETESSYGNFFGYINGETELTTKSRQTVRQTSLEWRLQMEKNFPHKEDL